MRAAIGYAMLFAPVLVIFVGGALEYGLLPLLGVFAAIALFAAWTYAAFWLIDQ